MFRVGITVYLMVATLAGPSLCCCSMERVTAFAFDAVFSSRNDQTASHCCCATTCSKESSKNGQQAPHDPDKCPCKEKSNSRIAMPPMERVEVSQSDLMAEFVASFAAATFGSEIVTVAVPFVREQSDSLHFSGQDMLLAFQTFRC